MFIRFADIEFVLRSYRKQGIILKGGAFDMQRGGQWFYV